MCRADLPVPIHAVQPQHIIVPVPVVYQSRESKVVRAFIAIIGVIGGVVLITYPYYS